MAKYNPKGLTKTELEKVDVDLLNANTVQLQCKKCKQVWSPNLTEGGKLPKGYWHCPNGCNT